MLKFVLLLTLLPLQNTLDRVEEARRQGRYQEALTLLRQTAEESPDLFRANHLLYMQSVIQQQAGLKDEARQGFETLLGTSFPLPDSVLLHLIQATEGSELDQRMSHFEAFLDRFPDHSRWPAISLQYADLLAENRQDEEARRWYERLISKGKSYVRTSRLRLAELFLNGHQAGTESEKRAKALALLKRLVAENDADSIALQAATHLKRIEPIASLTQAELRRRALAFINNRSGDAARPYLNRLLAISGRGLARAEYEHLSARSAQVEGRRREAIAAYDRNYRKFPASPWGVYSRYISANLSLGLQEYQQAVGGFRDIVDNHPDSEYFDRAVFGLADALLWLGDRAAAEAILNKGINKPGDRNRAFHYQLARLKIDEGRYQEAVTNLGPIAGLMSEELPSAVTREEVLYWKGFCEQQIGLAAASQESYRAASNGRANYFGYLARQRVEAVQDSTRLVASGTWSERLLKPRAEFTDARESSVREPSAVSGQRPAGSGQRPAVSRQQAAIRDLARLQELLFLRLPDEAYSELKGQGPGATVADKADYFFHLAIWAQRGGLFRQSLDEAEALRDLQFGRTPPELYPPELQRLLYPVPYWDLVVRFGEQNGIDPYLLLAIIRQESEFQPDAISPASARGLMQLVPSTARELSRRLRIPFKGSGQLYEPPTSIQLGSFYFRQMLDDFGGVMEKALAAYNGGGTNVRRWEKKVKSSQDPAIFVSHIGFRETKLYVLRVLGNYWTYRRLYAKEGS